MPKKMISTQEAAELLQVSDQTVINWIREGAIPNAIKLNPSKRNSPIKIPLQEVLAIRKKQHIRTNVPARRRQ
jgi:predicted site-specific integrase-resolvase